MEHQTCRRCVMDDTDPDFHLDSNGVCQVCIEAEQKLPMFTFTEGVERINLELLKSKILQRKSGEYDSILGLSGGVDSSYVALLAMEMGLNPLCVHFDNGWNSDTAVKNIRKIIDVTGFDLHTYVIDWPEFRDLQRAFLKASVLDIEILTDHAIFAALFKIRKQYGIKTVLSGTNYTTEHGMPSSWLWNKMDVTNIKAIHKRFGEMTMKSFPTMNTLSWLIMRKLRIGGIFEEPLNIVNYRKSDAMTQLKSTFEWEYYGGKHYESTFTKFYQAYILPTKFGIDKRRAHLSSLIVSKQLLREDAIIELNKPAYNQEQFAVDYDFVIKKLGFTKDEFELLMDEKPISHTYYGTQWDKNEFRKYYYFKLISNPFLKLYNIFVKK